MNWHILAKANWHLYDHSFCSVSGFDTWLMQYLLCRLSVNFLSGIFSVVEKVTVVPKWYLIVDEKNTKLDHTFLQQKIEHPTKSRSLRRESRAMSFLKRNPSRSNGIILGKLKIDGYPPIFYASTIYMN